MSSKRSTRAAGSDSDVAALALEHVDLRQQGKALFQQADEIVLGLVRARLVRRGKKIALADGRTVKLKDNFAGKTSTGKYCFIPRFELEFV